VRDSKCESKSARGCTVASRLVSIDRSRDRTGHGAGNNSGTGNRDVILQAWSAPRSESAR
jgi:hypothetical protein